MNGNLDTILGYNLNEELYGGAAAEIFCPWT